MNKKIAGSVLPPGTLKPTRAIASGIYEIYVEKADPVGSNPADGVYASCRYPDGWVKDHQVKTDDVAGLFQKIVGQLRGRYGAGEVKLVSAPDEIKPGATLTVEF
jgi:hypothetical protein